jgi:divalent metal cation (Fe/Co/Zn/Cd) transporter
MVTSAIAVDRPRALRFSTSATIRARPEVSAFLIAGSVALYLDALESIGHLLTEDVELAAVQITSNPADANHRF